MQFDDQLIKSLEEEFSELSDHYDEIFSQCVAKASIQGKIKDIYLTDEMILALLLNDSYEYKMELKEYVSADLYPYALFIFYHVPSFLVKQDISDNLEMAYIKMMKNCRHLNIKSYENVFSTPEYRKVFENLNKGYKHTLTIDMLSIIDLISENDNCSHNLLMSMKEYIEKILETKDILFMADKMRCKAVIERIKFRPNYQATKAILASIQSSLD